MAKELMDEKLWDTVQLLAEENKTDHAVVVIQSIASHVVGRYGGKQVEETVLPYSKEKLPTDQLTHMRKLSKEISILIEEHKYEMARQKTMDYLDGIIRLLASSDEEEKGLRKYYLKHFIRFGDEVERSDGRLEMAVGDETGLETYTTSEAAEVLKVSDQTVRRMCDVGRFPGATRTDGGHWRIPRKHFKITPEQSRNIDKNLKDLRKKSEEGGQVDEFDL